MYRGARADSGTRVAALSRSRSIAVQPDLKGSGWTAAAPQGGRVEEIRLPEIGSSPEEQIRALGFNPDHLAPDERDELLELHALCPDEALSV